MGLLALKMSNEKRRHIAFSCFELHGALELCLLRARLRTGIQIRFGCPCLRAQILVAQKVTAGVYKGVTTSELDELAAETAAALTSTHPDYAVVSPGSSPVRDSPTGADILPPICSWLPALPSPTCTRTR